MEKIKNKAHYIAVTCIIKKDDKFLICKRSNKEKVFSGKWCVPGGKLEQGEFIHSQKDTNDHWFDLFEKTITREIAEETNLSIRDIRYVSNLVFLRPNGFSTVIVSMAADFAGGELKLNEDELVEHAWVTLEEAKNYDLIENIYEQMVKAATQSSTKHI